MNYRKICLSILALLGSSLLTNALWEKVFSPLLDQILSWGNDIFNIYSSTYSDDVHRLAAVNFLGSSSNASVFVILVVLAMGALSFVLENFVKANFNRSILTVKLKYDLALVLCIAFLMQFFYQGTKMSEARKIHLRTEYNLVLLKPYISEKELNILESEFVQVGSKKDFDVFQKNLRSLANKHSIVLI